MDRASLCYQFDDVIIDRGAFTVEKGGQALALEPKSIRLLLYLVENRARAIDKEELLREVWPDDRSGEIASCNAINAVDVID